MRLGEGKDHSLQDAPFVRPSLTLCAWPPSPSLPLCFSLISFTPAHFISFHGCSKLLPRCLAQASLLNRPCCLHSLSPSIHQPLFILPVLKGHTKVEKSHPYNVWRCSYSCILVSCVVSVFSARTPTSLSPTSAVYLTTATSALSLETEPTGCIYRKTLIIRDWSTCV